jgi:hypothetical protein
LNKGRDYTGLAAAMGALGLAHRVAQPGLLITGGLVVIVKCTVSGTLPYTAAPQL